MTQSPDSNPIKLLLAEDEEDLRELLAFYLESQFGVKVLEAATGDEAIACLKSEPGIRLVVSDYRMPGGNGGKVFRYLQENSPSVPFILISSDRPENIPELAGAAIAGYVVKPDFKDSLRKLVAGVLAAITAESEEGRRSAGQVTSTHCPIRISLLKRLVYVPCDVFVRLSSEKFVKVAQAGDSFEGNDLKRFAAKKVPNLYVRNPDARLIIDRLVGIRDEFGADLTEEIHATLWSISRLLGFTPEVQALAKACVHSALKVIGSHPDLSELMARITDMKSDYLSRHSLTLPFIACGIAAKVGMNSEPTFYKLTMAAFLHDITLPTSAMARIHSLDGGSLGPDPLTAQELRTVKDHPAEAAAIAARFTEIPADVDIIVLQHHEQPDGSGFPGRLNHTRLSPLSCVFIAAHDFLDYHAEYGPAASTEEFLRIHGPKYNLGYFKKIAAALLEISKQKMV